MLTTHTASKFLADRKFRLARALSGSVTAALFLVCSTFLHAQSSPLTVQPTTGRVGVGSTNPLAAIEAKGTDVGISVMNNAANQNYYFGI